MTETAHKTVFDWLTTAAAWGGVLLGIWTASQQESHRRQDKEEANRPLLAVKEPTYKVVSAVRDRKPEIFEITNFGRGLAVNVSLDWYLDGKNVNTSVSSPKHVLPGNDASCKWLPPELTLGGKQTSDLLGREYREQKATLRMNAEGVDGRIFSSEQEVLIELPADPKEPIRLRFGDLKVSAPRAKPDAK